MGVIVKVGAGVSESVGITRVLTGEGATVGRAVGSSSAGRASLLTGAETEAHPAKSIARAITDIMAGKNLPLSVRVGCLVNIIITSLTEPLL